MTLSKGIALLSRVAVLAALTGAVSSPALTIVRDFVAPGSYVPGTGHLSLEPSTNSIGGGDWKAVCNAACDMWEKAIPEQYTLTIHFAWAATGSGRAEHSAMSFGGTPYREIEGSILIDNQPGGWRFYLDPTPWTHEEYREYQEHTLELGGGQVNVERRYSLPTGLAAISGYHDLLTTVIHEVGHSVGLTFANPAFQNTSGDGRIEILPPLPFAGTSIRLSPNNYGYTTNLEASSTEKMAMMGGTTTERILPSAADVLIMAQLNTLDSFVLDPSPVQYVYEQGLHADYYDTTSPFADLPWCETLSATQSAFVSQINFAVGTTTWPGLDIRFADTYAARFSGYIKIDVEGDYTFYPLSDDGARLWLGGGTFGSGCPDWHAGQVMECSYTVHLKPGYTALALEYAQNYGSSACVLSWSGPGFAKQVIAGSSLYHTRRVTPQQTWTFVDADKVAGGTYSVKNNQLTLTGRGNELWDVDADFVGLTRTDITGDFDLSVKVVSMTNTHSSAKAGIIIANDLNNLEAGGYSLVALTPGFGAVWDWDNDGNGTLDWHRNCGRALGTGNVWVRIKKAGTSFSTYYKTSASGAWIQIDQAHTIASAAANSQVGLFGFSHDNNRTCTSVFQNLTNSGTVINDFNPPPSPWGFVDADKAAGGSWSATDGHFELTGSGTELWGADADFVGLHRSDITGNYDISVKVSSMTNTHEHAKAGILIANNVNNLAAGGYALVGLTPGHGVVWDWDNDGDGTLDWHRNSGNVLGTGNVWVRITKVGKVFSTYYRTSESAPWTQIDVARTLGSAAVNSQVCLFGFSHDVTKTLTATFDGFVRQ